MALYIVQRCRKDNRLYGPTHASEDGDNTSCGIEMDHNWWILKAGERGRDAEVTCRKCKKVEQGEVAQ